jgi:pimeloyl-ACP methyl ester carboxylesterase
MVNVILLHGFCEHKAMWAGQVKSLSACCRVEAIDLCGFGDNDSTAVSMEHYAQNVIEQMNVLDMDDAIIIGHSMGGYVALDMLARFPNRLTGLGLVHSQAAADDKDRLNARQKQIDFLSRYDTEPYLKPFSEQLVSEENRKDGEMLQRTWELVRHTNKTAITNALVAMMSRTDHTQLLKNSSIPMLWLLGAKDDFIPLKVGLEQAATCTQASLHVMQDVGHLAPFEAQEETNTILEQFIKWVASS